MERMSSDLIKHLAKEQAKPCLTAYFPVEHGWPAAKSNAIVLKNIIRDVEKQLAAMSDGQALRNAFLEPLTSLNGDTLAREDIGPGICIMADKDGSKTCIAPIKTEPFSHIGNEYYLKPFLLPVAADASFYVLELTQKQVRLYEGTRWYFKDITPSDLPRNLNEALPYENPEKQLQFHTGAGYNAGTGKRDAIYHGQGAADNRKKWIPRFCERVAGVIENHLAADNKALVLAGVEEVLSTFRHLSHYPCIHDRDVRGNPEYFEKGELHRKACAVLEPVFNASVDEALHRYSKDEKNGQVATGFRDVFSCLKESRIDTLFIAEDVTQWGRIADAAERVVDEHEQRKNGDSELLNLAAVMALQSGSTVYNLPRERIPGGTDAGIAGSLRF